MNVKEKIELAVNFVLVGELMIAQKIILELSTQELNDASMEEKKLIDRLEVFFDFEKNEEDGLYHVSNDYRTYLLNKLENN